MNGGPPPDWDEAPPASPDDYGQPSGGKGGGGGNGGQRGGKRQGPPALTKDEIAQLSEDFYAWLETPETLRQLTMLLPDHVDAKVFVATAKTAVLTKPKMLRETMRASLLLAIMKAAAMGLLPDGKQGALVERYDSDSKEYLIAFQPMVWGIAKLGRETGAIKTIRAMLVFRGEKFRVLAGEEDRIEHEVDPDIVEEAYAALNGGKDQWGNPAAKPAEFLARVRASYCFITAPDGTITRRWMTHNRIMSLYESTKAGKGPWSGRFIDEMILKGVILFTSKWINLDQNTAEAKRFQSALMTDMDIDFNRQGQIAAPAEQEDRPERPTQAALPPPFDKLSTLEDQIMGGMTDKVTNAREKAPATNVSEGGPVAAKQDRAGATGGGDGRVTPPGPATQTKAEAQTEPPADDVSFIERACQALEREQAGAKWMAALIFAAKGVGSAEDLGRLKKLPTVIENLKNGPPAARSQISTLLAQAAQNLAPKHEDIPQQPNEEAA